MASMNEIIGRTVRKSNEVDSDIGLIGDETILPGGFFETVLVHENGIKKNKMIPDKENSFILSHRAGCVLGSLGNKLGVGSDLIEELISVESTNNTFYETFNSLDYINTDESTGSFSVDTGSIILNNNDTIISNHVFASDSKICSNVNISLMTEGYELGSSTFFVKNTSLGSWEEYVEDNDGNYYFNDIGSELFYKIESGSDNNYIKLDNNLSIFKVKYTTQDYKKTFVEYGESDSFYDIGSSSGFAYNTDYLNPYFRLTNNTDEMITNELPLQDDYSSVYIELGSELGSFATYISNDDKNTWSQIFNNSINDFQISSDNNTYIKFINTNQATIINSTIFTSITPSFPMVFTDEATDDISYLYPNNKNELYKLIFYK